MVKTGKNLPIFYPNLTHVTRFAHGLHRVAGTIRSEAKTTNILVASVRKIFYKDFYVSGVVPELTAATGASANQIGHMACGCLVLRVENSYSS